MSTSPSATAERSRCRDVFAIADKTIVITGGCGRLGSSFAGELLARGARVATVDRAEARRGENDARLLHVVADVTDRASLEDGLRVIRSRFGEVSGLVACAAIDAPPDASATDHGPVERVGREAWDRMLDVNVTGTFHSAQVFGDAMARAGGGSIVFVSSIYGIVSPDQRLYAHRRARGEAFFKPLAYAVSKAAIPNMARYLATYWADRNVRVNTITLGGVQDGQERAFVDAYAARVPLGRMARVDEYDGAVVFLLSEASSYMTGANLVLDGGWTAW